MARRIEQVQSTIRRTLGEILSQGLSDPRIEGMITLLDVNVSPDLRNAEVRISVLPDRFAKKSLGGLQHAAGHLQKEVARRIRMKTVPHLHFKLDGSIKKQAEVLSAIQEAIGSDASSEKDESAAKGSQGLDMESSQ